MDSSGLRWVPGQPPYSERYRDHYWSRAGGLGEARHVFLDGNGLPQRWRQRERFAIGETGFGSGLNFLATWQAWAGDPQRCRRLHFISVELHPLAAGELQQVLAAWPQLAALTADLVAAWPEPVPGWHRLTLADDRLLLDLLFGEAGVEFGRLDAAIDAWYLDGFAPARNPAMWRPELLAEVARLTVAGGTVATYSVAGVVRRGLREAGFEVTKGPGFAGKREMLAGKLAKPVLAKPRSRPWLQPPLPLAADEAVVVGAGLAGCAMADALARRGWLVTLLERRAAPALAASGNPAGVVMPRAEAQRGPAGQWYLQAYLHALRVLARYAGAADWQPTGVLALAANSQRQRRYQRFVEAYGLPGTVACWVDSAAATTVAGVVLDRGALYYPGGGWLAPSGWCRALVERPRVSSRYRVDAVRLEQLADGWQVLGASGEVLAAAPVVVLANANGAAAYESTSWLPLVAARGQLSAAPVTAASGRLQTVLYGKGYLIPARQGRHVIGATLTAHDSDTRLRAADDVHNRVQLERIVPQLAAELTPELSGIFAAIRATSPDRLPLIGGVPDPAAFRAAYTAAARGAMGRKLPPPPHARGLYLLTGLGARGITVAPLAAELLAALIAGEPVPLARDLSDAVNPSRLLFRALQRGEY